MAFALFSCKRHAAGRVTGWHSSPCECGAALPRPYPPARGASPVQARAERLRQRTEDARHLRHARVLRRFWQTRAGLTLADAGLAALVVGGAAGLAWAWKLHLAQGAARQAAAAAGQPQQQPTAAAAT